LLLFSSSFVFAFGAESLIFSQCIFLGFLCSFLVDCDGFTDSHLPIRYSFGTRPNSTASPIFWLLTSTQSSSVIVPPFIQAGSFEIVILVEDAYGFQTPVQPFPSWVLVRVPPPPCIVFNETVQQLWNAVALDDVHEALYLISVLTDFLFPHSASSSSCAFLPWEIQMYRFQFVSLLEEILNETILLPCSSVVDILEGILSFPRISQPLALDIQSVLEEALLAQNCFDEGFFTGTNSTGSLDCFSSFHFSSCIRCLVRSFLLFWV
jgi:hypothetical protein